MKNIIYGGKGFIGQNLCKQLLRNGDEVLIIDKDTWNIPFFYSQEMSDNVKFLKININENKSFLKKSIEDLGFGISDTLNWHLAANSDIVSGVDDIYVDLNDTFLTTVNILDLMRSFDQKKIIFASSSAVYGSSVLPESGFSEQSLTAPISNYGAMKLASEAIIRANYENFLDYALICRFPNVIGFPATHGVIYDFIKKLIQNSNELHVLGDGKQNKPYLHVDDLVDAMLFLNNVLNHSGFDVINIASNHPNVFVKEIAEMVVSKTAPSATIEYGDTPYGWVGDMPKVEFNVSKLSKLGWKAKMSGHHAVLKTIEDNLEFLK